MTVKRVSPQEANELLAQGFVYVDVRTEPEFKAMRVKGSVNVPLLSADAVGRRVPNAAFLSTMKASFPPGSKFVLGCQTGQRSLHAAKILESEGYAEVVEQRAGMAGARDMMGRMVEAGWLDAGLPTESN